MKISMHNLNDATFSSLKVFIPTFSFSSIYPCISHPSFNQQHHTKNLIKVIGVENSDRYK